MATETRSDKAMALFGVTVDLQDLIARNGVMVSACQPDRQRAFELLRELQTGLRGLAGGSGGGDVLRIIDGARGNMVDLLRGVAEAINSQDDATLGDAATLRELLVASDMLGATIRNFLHIESVVG